MNLTRRRLCQLAGGLAVTPIVASLFPGISAASTFALKTADGRNIAVICCRAQKRRGTILFSHGANSSPAYYNRLIDPWVQAGYDVWAPLHLDKEPGSWRARMEDMHALADHVDVPQYIAAGHSYGALTALTLAGTSPVPPAGMVGTLADHRVQAVVGFSPPGLMPGLIEPNSYATLGVPALIQTGTQDFPYAPGEAKPDPESWQEHLRAYEEPASGGDRYALIIDGVDHYFGGAICDFNRAGPPQSQEAELAAHVARIFIDAQVQPDKKSRARLLRRLAATGPVKLLTR